MKNDTNKLKYADQRGNTGCGERSFSVTTARAIWYEAKGAPVYRTPSQPRSLSS